MPGYKTHVSVGFFLSIIITGLLFYYKKTPTSMALFGIFIGSIYSCISDCDIRTSIAFKVWASTFAVAALSFVVTLILASKGAIAFQFSTVHYIIAAFVSIVFLLSVFLKHRGIMHSYGMAAITSLPWAYYNPWLSLYAFVGYSSHIFMDRWRPDKILGGEQKWVKTR